MTKCRVGAGWGSFAAELASRLRDLIFGYTLSRRLDTLFITKVTLSRLTDD